MEGATRSARRPPKPKCDRFAKRWGDPDDLDQESGASEEEAGEKFHPQTDQGDKEDDEGSEEEALRGSDSDDDRGGVGGQDDADLQEILGRVGQRRQAAAEAKAPPAQQGEDASSWDPLSGLAARKRRKTAPAANKNVVGAAAAAPSGQSSGASPRSLQEGTFVCLVGLQGAQHLNGSTGRVAAAMDTATGRIQVILRDGTAKSLRRDNLREVFTGAVVRICGLKGAPELNGRIAECGDLDVASGRYLVTLADGKETTKRVKSENVELVKRYVSATQVLASPPGAPPVWPPGFGVVPGAAQTHRPWAESLRWLAEHSMPAPRLIAGDALAKLLEGSSGDGLLRLPDAVAADSAPTDDNGLLVGRLLALSLERDHCCPSDAPRPRDIQRLAQLAKALIQHDPQRPLFFLVPHCVVKPLPCLRSAASVAWPLYLQLAQGLVCLETEHQQHKGWCRFDALLTSSVATRPVYIAAASGGFTIGGSDSWLLSDRQESWSIGSPADGQTVQSERPLLNKMGAELLPKGARGAAEITAHRL